MSLLIFRTCLETLPASSSANEMQGVIELGYRSVIIRDAAALLRHVAPGNDE